MTSLSISPVLSRIALFPIKALDGVVVNEATIRSGGGLCGDRELAIFDASGRFVNGKREARVHTLRASYDLTTRVASLQRDGSGPAHFHMDGDRARLEDWLSDHFRYRVHLRQNSERGFPDDPTFFGPTVVCTETLAEVASWFPGLDLEAVRRRFRTSLELAGAVPFWEDRLVANGEPVIFRIGAVRLEGTMPWPRCVVPTRDADTGAATPMFQKSFSDRRRATLPVWAPQSQFDHFYRLCVGTRVPASEAGKVLRTGEPVTIAET